MRLLTKVGAFRSVAEPEQLVHIHHTLLKHNDEVVGPHPLAGAATAATCRNDAQQQLVSMG